MLEEVGLAKARDHKSRPSLSSVLRQTIKGSVVSFGAVALFAATARAQSPCVIDHQNIPADIQAVFNKPFYDGAIWGLRVDDLDTGKTLIDLKPDCPLFIGSVRKVFSVGELVNQIGPDYRYNTPVFRVGDVDSRGVLHGDLVLVASGDLTMGGRTNPDGTIAVTNYDHNEADSLGNAVLSAPDPLAGYKALAHQVAQHGITEVKGDVIIDDRLFQPFLFRNEFYVRPIFVNDDVVDASIRPTQVGERSQVAIRPLSSALRVKNQLFTGPAGSTSTLELNPELPQCIGRPRCSARIEGELPVDFRPPFTNQFPLVQTFRIVEPSNYARTVLIEALAAEGISVHSRRVAPNRTDMLPNGQSYENSQKVAELAGRPYSDDMRLVLKVSYNIGADTSLVLFGLTRGANNMDDALAVERRILPSVYHVPDDQFHFVDGSGGGDTVATSQAVITMLTELRKHPTFPAFFDALPILAIDGSLAGVTDFKSDATLAGAAGQVRAKTGTYVGADPTGAGLLLKGQAFAGYIATSHGKHLVYEVIVNNVPVGGIGDVYQIFQDEGTASAILWRDF
ncbi:MAG TPA: D-alanyl-D-alanine carboxypeptidase [Rhodopila sp.]|nr:D-alanyl-D-alanine carboxypeptidase [Rhodopila sp.]